MYSIARLRVKDRKALIGNTAAIAGLHAAIVEKDFWVCIMLDYLFHKSPWYCHLAFKGGTSLSKAYQVIERFSEDIDLILDWRLLGYDLHEPWHERSQNQQNIFGKVANRRTVELIKNNFLPRMNEDMRKLIGRSNCMSMLEEAENKDGEQTIVFRYPKSFALSSILPEIRLEFGALAAWSPLEEKTITPITAEHYPHMFTQADTKIRTTAIERAFWEKATILHREAYRKPESSMPPRYARHYYDLYCLYNSPFRDSLFKTFDILEQVAKFKSKFYHDAWSDYGEARPGSLRLLPAQHNYDILKKDYQDMQGMFYGKYPDFDELMTAIAAIEDEINTCPPDLKPE